MTLTECFFSTVLYSVIPLNIPILKSLALIKSAVCCGLTLLIKTGGSPCFFNHFLILFLFFVVSPAMLYIHSFGLNPKIFLFSFGLIAVLAAAIIFFFFLIFVGETTLTSAPA